MLRILRIVTAAVLLSVAAIASLAPQALAQNRTDGPTASISGTTWRGDFDSQSDYTTTYRFNADGSAEWSDNGQAPWTGRENHTWTQDGSSVTWRHNDGTTWVGNLRPNSRLTGVIYGMDGEPRGVFRLTRQ